MKKLTLILIAMLLFVTGISSTLAETIIPFADDVFDATKVELSSAGRVKLYCVTYENHNSIKVTACWLEKKTNEKWAYDCSVTPPQSESTNTNGYAASFNCLSSIGKGTYRIAATFNADGHEITRYSTSTVFN